MFVKQCMLSFVLCCFVPSSIIMTKQLERVEVVSGVSLPFMERLLDGLHII